MRLSNKRSLVTGGAQGIGHAIAETFGREGAIVYIADVNEETGAAAEARLRETGTRATAGLPARAITTSSPRWAASISLERLVFASWILT